ICTEDFTTEGEAQTAFATLSRQSSLVATSVSRKVTAMPPPLLYDLTTLQKEANRQLGFSADSAQLSSKVFRVKQARNSMPISCFVAMVPPLLNLTTPHLNPKVGSKP
ncbi:MAG: hypothetical protein HXL27_07445, partial [Prevotellaceae bacterium]|nr:hypothetical protein [Prevotellaceae bacterium]